MKKILRSLALLSIITATCAHYGFAQEIPAKPTTDKKTVEKGATPKTLPGYEPYVFRTVGETELRLHVIKPPGWKTSDQRACLVYFFGGGWTNGDPTGSIYWSRWAASHGMVGVAPDYRTFSRHKSTIEQSISDGRAAIIWLQEHATELGIDPAKIVASGVSAGGHLAAWSAITQKGPSADDPGAPKPQPAALIMLNPATDTKSSGPTGSLKHLDGSAARGLACSVTDQMPVKMPPTIVFHATGDKVVPYANSVEFRDKMVKNANSCELVTFEGMGHMYYMPSFGAEGIAARQKTEDDISRFLFGLGLIKSTEGKK